MQSDHERRIREVWETTQENLETAVGSAYSRWTIVNNQYVNPSLQSINGCVSGCFGVCFTNERNSNHRRNSMDFFDMYDEEGEFGRDELERLLNDENIDEYDEQEDNSIRGGGGGPPKRSFITVIGSILPLWATPNRLKYKPSTAGLQGFTRSRSSTKSSIQSSETFRSRADLFSDEEYEDAQMVSDNFAASLVFGRNRGSTIGSKASNDSKSVDSRQEAAAAAAAAAVPPPPTTLEPPSDEALREEERQIEHEEEANTDV